MNPKTVVLVFTVLSMSSGLAALLVADAPAIFTNGTLCLWFAVAAILEQRKQRRQMLHVEDAKDAPSAEDDDRQDRTAW